MVTVTRRAIYTKGSGKSFQGCHPVEPADYSLTQKLQQAEGPLAATWDPPLVRLDEWSFAGKHLLPSDAPWFDGFTLILNRRAVDAMASLLEGYGELLPLRCAQDELFAFNPALTLDALDEARSTLRRLPSGRAIAIEKWAFKPEVVAGADMFRITTLRLSEVYLSQRFVDLWHASGLKSPDFKLCVEAEP